MEWQILTTFFTLLSLLIGVVVLIAQTRIKQVQNAQAETLIQLLASSTSTLSIVREMDKQQDLFVRQMPPHVDVVAPMDTEDAPEGYKWLTSQSEADVNERFRDAARKAAADFNARKPYEKSAINNPVIALEHIPSKRGRPKGSRGPYKKRTTQ